MQITDNIKNIKDYAKIMISLYKTGKFEGLVLKKSEKPNIKDDEVLVRVLSTSICGTDIHLFNWDGYCSNIDISFPRIIGHEVFGMIEQIGPDVTNFDTGDIVSSESHIFCDNCYNCLHGLKHLCENIKILGEDINGTFAQYVALPSKILWRHKKEIESYLGCLYEPFGNSVELFSTVNPNGKNILITGCGAIGLFSILLGRYYGANKIVAVEISDYRCNLAMNLNADYVLNPRVENVTTEINALSKNFPFDICLEMSGSEEGIRLCFSSIKMGGKLVLFGLPTKPFPIDVSNQIVLRGISIFGITGRKIFDTWNKTDTIIREMKNDLKKIVTHKFRLNDYDKAFNLLKKKECGKIVFNLS